MKTYTFETKDKSHTLRYNYNSICDLEEATGKALQDIFSENVGVNTIRLLLWAGLRWKNQGLTKQQVGFIIDELAEFGMLEEVAQKAVELLGSSLSTGQEVGE
jgi:hypothetical protein